MSVGVGYLTGIGVHAANGAAHFLDADDGKSLLLGSVSFHEAEQWVNAIENVITDLKEAVAEIPTANLLNYSHTHSNVGGHSTATATISTAGVYDKSKQIRRNTSYQTHVVRPEVRITEVEEWIMTSKWKVFDVYEGLRLLHIYQPGEIGISSSSSSSLSSSTQGGVVDTSCMRVDISVNASAAETFTMIHNFTDTLQTGIIKSLRVVETIDNFTDIIHLKLEPIYLHPTWTGTVVVSVSVSIYVCVSMYVCMYVCMNGWMDGWMYLCMYVCMYVCLCVCIFTYVYMYVCMYLYVSMYVTSSSSNLS